MKQAARDAPLPLFQPEFVFDAVDAEGKQGFLSRRGFIKVVAAGAAGLSLASCTSEQRAVGRGSGGARTTAFITPNEEFFLVAVDPAFRPALGMASVETAWSLQITDVDGRVRPLSYSALTQRAHHRIHHTFECIGNPVGGELIGNALWHVVPLKSLLLDGGSSGARAVMFEGLDNYYSSVSIERATDDYAFIAMRMNGEPLSAAHGFPARVILPDLYGMKQPRWLRRIRLLETQETTSLWEERGWAGEVPVKTVSRIDSVTPLAAGRPTHITGTAFAGARGIERVEISIDGGAHWLPCELVPPHEPHAWTLWRYTWPHPVRGRHTLQVRATDFSGKVQSAIRQGRRPDGASGYHQRDVVVQDRQ